jgi:hypothetical protein
LIRLPPPSLPLIPFLTSPKTISKGFIVLFTYMYIKYINYIQPSSPSPFTFPLSLVTLPQKNPGPVLYSCPSFKKFTLVQRAFTVVFHNAYIILYTLSFPIPLPPL